jgi:hypothetical protein
MARVPELVRLRSLAHRSRTRAKEHARDLRLLPGEPGPAGRIDSLSAWFASEAPAGGKVVELPEHDARASRAEPKSVQQGVHPKLEATGQRPTARRSVLVAAIPGGRLATEYALVISPDNRVFAETAWDEEQLEASRVLHLRRLPPARRLRGMHASLISQWGSNYAHWLLEVLPRLALLEEAGFADARLIVYPRLGTFQRDSLELLGVRDERLTPFRDAHVQADVLVWSQAPDHTGNPSSWTCRWLRDRFVTVAGRRAGVGRRLYVSRRGMSRATRRRSVANEDEVIALLEPWDFEVIQPEQLSFREQVSTFAEAEAVVAPHGAALTSLVFAQPIPVLELFDRSYVNPIFYSLASAVGHDYWYLVGDRVGHADMNVPLDALRETLDRMLP